MEKAAGDLREKRTGSAELDETPFFGGSWQGWCAGRGSEVTALSLPRW